jgi:hypothetical protein
MSNEVADGTNRFGADSGLGLVQPVCGTHHFAEPITKWSEPGEPALAIDEADIEFKNL